MEGEKIDIHRKFDDAEPIYLGTVKVIGTEGLETYQDVFSLIDGLWYSFYETHPDSDSQFIDFLVDEKPEIFERDDGNYNLFVGV